MVRWRRVVSLPVDADPRRRGAVFRACSFTRLPVVDRAGRAIAIVSWVDAALDRAAPTRELAAPALTVAPDTKVLDALATMRHARQPMAIVEDRQTKQPLGLVTLKDLAEPLTGELPAW
jgi:CBS domain containing-hemolysin-like protein